MAWPILLLLFLTVLGGCQAKEPPLSQKAAAFKKEVLDCLDRLCSGLVVAILNGDVDGINETLKKMEPEKIKLCRMCPFRIGILNKHGQTLTVYPFKMEAMGNFASYEGVALTLKNRLINQQRLYLQDGSQIYLIFIPLLKDNTLVGIMVLSLSAKDAQDHWGLTEKEFMQINFNIKS
ncbi:MAG: hypothetical protein M1438_17830 [Deltaproteobacteria bacterium]|nr:hypothetical protein [Deltaproteobacteria bacterium]